MRSCYVKIASSLLTVMMLISLTSCAFVLENQKIQNFVYCESNKCCYDVKNEVITQVCSTGSTHELTIIIIHNDIQ